MTFYSAPPWLRALADARATDTPVTLNGVTSPTMGEGHKSKYSSIVLQRFRGSANLM